MDRATFAAITARLGTFPDLRHVTFGGFGEPLVHPRIVEMVASARILGARITRIRDDKGPQQATTQAALRALYERQFLAKGRRRPAAP